MIKNELKKASGAISKAISFTLRLLPPYLQKDVLQNFRLSVPLDYRLPLKIRVLNQPTYHRKNSCKKEPETVEWIEKYLKEDGVFYDIGANVGAYSLVAAKAKPKAKIFSFEPSFSTFYSLCLNIYENNLSEQITPLNIALSSSSCLGTFNYVSIYENLSGVESGLAFHFAEKDVYDVSSKSRVDLKLKQPFMTLDKLQSSFDLPFPNLIKIDVDGIEFDILSNATNVLKNETCRHIILEIPTKDTDGSGKIINFLGEFGFKIVDKSDRQNEYINVILQR